MLGREDFGRLAMFTQLTELQVGEDVLKDLHDCHSVLKYLPRLKLFCVQKSEANDDMDTEKKGGYQQNGTSNKITQYNNIKDFSFRSCPYSRDRDLIHIMNTYTKLDQLTMRGMTATSWPPVATVSSHVMLSFLKYIQQCKEICLMFRGVSGKQWLLDLFYDSFGSIQKKEEDNSGKGGSLFKTHFSISTQKEAISLELRGKFQLVFHKTGGLYPHTYAQLTCGFNDNKEEQWSKIKTNLMNLHPSTEYVTTSGSGGLAPIEAYVDAILDGTPQHVNLKSMLFYGGDLLDYTSDGASNRARHNIKELDFTETAIYQAALCKLSADFPTLDLLEFEQCKFNEEMTKEIFGHVEIAMSDTVIDTLRF